MRVFEKQGIKGLIPKPKGRPPIKPKYPKMPPKPKAQNRRRTFEISDFGAGSGECHSKKIAKTQPTKNAEKAAITKALCIYFPLTILLDLINLTRSVFFYHLKTKNDKAEQNKVYVM